METPFVVLATTTADGSGFEPVAAPALERSGDSVFVSGEITHFSALAGLSLQLTIEMALHSIERSTSVEPGIDWRFGLQVRNQEGEIVEGMTIEGHGEDAGSSGIASGPTGPLSTILCEFSGRTPQGISFDVDTSQAQDVHTFYRRLPLFSSLAEDDRTPLPHGWAVRYSGAFICPPTVVGTPVSGSSVVDHPGGPQIVPHFGGGRSAALTDYDLPPGYVGQEPGDSLWGDWEQVHWGLIRDNNSNGHFDEPDIVYQPVSAETDGTSVLPLFSYGQYIPYATASAGEAPPSFSPFPLADGGAFLEHFDPLGFGLLGDADGPHTIVVGSGEGDVVWADGFLVSWPGLDELTAEQNGYPLLIIPTRNE